MGKTLLPSVANTILLTKGKSSGIKLEGLSSALKKFRKPKAPNIVILEDIAFVDQDVTLPVVALDDKRVFYTFGKNFGMLTLTGSIFYGCGNSPKFPAIKAVQDAFEQMRVSSSKKPKKLSVVGGFSCKVYVQQLEIVQAVPAYQTIKFRLSCTVVPPANKG